MRLHTDGSSVDGTRNVTWPAPKNGNAVNFQGNNLLATRLKIICFVSLGLISCLATGASKLSFSPQYKAAAEVVSKGQEIKVTVKVGSQEATDIFTFETERKLRLAVDDFDFDGHKDFSVSHTDDGMGNHLISHLYRYSAIDRKFVPMAPKCGDEFINIVVSKQKRTLTNSYVFGNRYLTCTIEFK